MGQQLQNADAIELARTKSELLAAAQRSGVADTPALRAQIDALAGEYVKAGAAADLAASKIEDVQKASRAGAESVADVFTQMATGALSAKEAVGQLVLEILKMSLKKRLLESASGAGGSFLGSVLGFLGAGFAEGGYTGNGGKFEPAGVAHKGEYYFSAAATKAIGVPQLEALHQSAKRGYSSGGYVGAAANLKSGPSGRSSAAHSTSNPINITNNVSVEGSAGSPEQNADLSAKMAKSLESTMRGVVVGELQNQLRNGNMLGRRK